jgi:hypothetical protein
MEVSEQELRAMIREAIARQAGGSQAREISNAPAGDAVVLHVHASHHLFPVPPGGDGECIIEPTVRCNHCGYCKSLGH